MTGNIAKINTFVLSNIAPQYPTHNSKAWANWEDYTHEKAEKHGVVFVITGVTGGTGKFVPEFVNINASILKVFYLQNE